MPVTEIALGALERTAPEVGDVAVKVFAIANGLAIKSPAQSTAAKAAEVDIFFTFTPYSPELPRLARIRSNPLITLDSGHAYL